MARSLVFAISLMTLAACAPDAADTGTPATTDAIDPTGSWTIEAIGDRPVIDKSPTAMTFTTDGTVAGNAGCNQFTGGFELSGTRLSMGPLAVTQRMCAVEALMEQEGRFLKALQQVDGVSMDNGLLVMTDASGETLVRASRQPE